MTNKITISEFGLIGTDESVYSANKFLSANVNSTDVYKELESFAKTDSGKDVLGFTGNGKYLQAKSYVGTIQTKSGLTLEILPKTANKGDIETSKQIFMKLLHLLHRLPSYKNIDTANFERIKNIDIFEIFIVMFLDEVGQIIKKGVKSDYTAREENLFFLKGKLRISEHIKHNSIHKERFYVEYDDYNQNRAENRLIKSTLQLLSKLSKDFQNIRRIRQYMEHMNWVDLSMNVDNDLRSVKLGRGMEHYKNALIWAKVFLKKESFSSFSGDTIAFAILYPMEKLFEGFVEWYLNKTEPNSEVIPQSGETRFVTSQDEKEKLFGVRPDFLIKKGDEIVCVADAKWKLITSKNDFSQGDFYQLFAYKEIFSLKKSKKIDDLRIYYPQTDDFKDPQVYIYFDGGEIKVTPLNLEYELLKNKEEN
jgi:5-methylcytosine-specific restriction enzyme subunit McrC